MISMVDCLLTLSVPVDEEITTQQAERKALEIEKMFKVILDFDINKLKYKNSEDFLKNAAERLMFGAFATDLPHQIDNYRKLVAQGKLKDPINPTTWSVRSWAFHFITVMCNFTNNLEVTFLPLYYPSEAE